jgi:potassium/hydrogen antiporter
MENWLYIVQLSLLVAGVLLTVSVLTSKALEKLGVPALLIFLLIGILAGSEGIGRIQFDNPFLAQAIGVVALAVILFSGGLDTNWENSRKVFFQAVGLSTFGVLMTTLLVGFFVRFVLQFSIMESLLLGAVVSSTDAAAVFSILRSKKVNLKDNMKYLLEFESGSNDPMAVFLTLLLIMIINNTNNSFIEPVSFFFYQMIIGAFVGYAMGRLTVYVINRIKLEYEGLYIVMMVANILLIFSISSLLAGNGFLSVYIAGIVIGNSRIVHKRSLMKFHDGLAWLMQITMFLALGLLVFPSMLVPVTANGLLIAGFLIFIARPVAVFITLAFSKLNIKEKTFVSWVGLRGAAPIILATYPLMADTPNAFLIFNIVFFIVFTSSLLQGPSIVKAADWLGVASPEHEEENLFLPSLSPEECITCKLHEIKVSPESNLVGKQIVDLDIPQNSYILLMNREKKLLRPSGKTVIQPDDILLVLAERENIDAFKLDYHEIE